MGKFSNGPDGTDVPAMMMAIQTLHSGRVELIVSVAGPGFTPLGETRCRMSFDVLPGSSLPKVVEVVGKWPCPDHQTIDAHLYAGLYELDFEIGKAYKQETLWGK